MRSGGHAAGHLLHQRVSVHAHPLRNQLLFRAKCVAEPAHRQSGKEADRLRLRHAGDHMRIHTNIHIGIGTHLWQIHHLLPESPAQHRRLSGVYYAKAEAAELHIAAAHHHRRAFAQPAQRCGFPRYRAEHRTCFFYRGENIRAQPGHIQQGGSPVAAEQIQHTGGACI